MQFAELDQGEDARLRQCVYLSLKYCCRWLTFFLAVLVVPVAAQNSSPPSGANVTLSGILVNSVTGEPIARAIVAVNGQVSRTVFTDSDGHFEIADLPPGEVTLNARKPGFYSERNDAGSLPARVEVGAKAGGITLKLTPLSAIRGRVTDTSGMPIERLPLRLSGSDIRNGRRVWEYRSMTDTDEDGRFRFANLNPGTYYLAAGPLQDRRRILVEDEKPKTGFPHMYYPGVPELASAMPIQLSAGQQTEADFSLSPVPVYGVSGVVSGEAPDQGVGFQILAPSGDDLSVPTRFSMENGAFHIESIPAGTYVIKVFSQAGLQQLRAEVKLNVASNLEDVRLVLAPAISIPILVRMESRSSSDTTTGTRGQNRAPVSVQLLPNDASAPEAFSTFQQNAPGQGGMVLQNVNYGSYSVVVGAQPPWYVQSATYGQTNLLYDDISIGPGQNYPIEIVLRDDSATLNATVRTPDGKSNTSSVLVVPQPLSKSNIHLMQGSGNDVSVSGLAPGDYLVYAFDRIDGLEYTKADVLQPYSSQAAHVTLTANQKAQVSVDLIHAGKGD